MEDEIDLRKYVNVLVKHWKLIAIITGIAVVVAGLVSFLSPAVYEARTALLVTSANVPNQQTLLDMAKSSNVATQVIEQLEDKLQPVERSVGNMLDKVQVSAQGNLINISVKSNDPEKAAAIASAWAKSYQSYVNSFIMEGLQAKTNAAKKEYEEKQKALENLIKDNRIDELNRQINDKEILYDARLLREHIKSSSSSVAPSTANSLALVLLQTRAFTSLPEGLQISLSTPSGSDATLDAVDALISTLEARSGGKKGQSLTELQQDIGTLKAELEQESARQRELTDARNIAWQAYTITGKSLRQKLLLKHKPA